MTNRELENRLAQAISHTAPDDFEDVISRSETKKGKVNLMMHTPKKKKRAAALGGLIAACLALMLAGGGLYHYQSKTVASVISLDVNPSIELSINKNDKVLSCTPLNADAALVLFDMGGGADLKGTKVDVAVNAIIGALVRNGYLDSVSSAILITVEDNNAERAARLQEELSALTSSILQEQDSGAGVISQTLAVDAGLEHQAHQSSISTGKAALINQVIAMNDSLQFSLLAELTVGELQDLIKAGAPAMPIGKSAASYAAESFAGTAAMNSVTAEVDSELDENPAHYEVELHTAFGTFEYLVDAYTGEILSGQGNIVDYAKNSGQTTQPDNSGQTSPTQPDGSKPQETSYIGLDAAKSAALTHAGIHESDTTYCNYWLDYDDGHPDCYKVEFAVGNIDYEYEIGLYDCSVLKCETEHHDSDYHDSDYHDSDYHDSSHHGSSSGSNASSGSSTGNNTSSGYTDIGQNAAKQAALSHAGLTESQVRGLKVEREYDDGRLEYEVEFRYGELEYEYKIDGITGAVLEYECDED